MDSGQASRPGTIPFYQGGNDDYQRLIIRLAKENRIAELHTLGEALDAEADDLRIRLNRAENALDFLADTLAATPGDVYLETLLKLLPNRPFLYNRLRGLMAIAAREQPPETLQTLLAKYLDNNAFLQAVGEYHYVELLSLLVQEVVIRGIQVGNVAGIGRLLARQAARQHGLSWLPLTLNPLENELLNYLPPRRQRIAPTLPSLSEAGTLNLGDAPRPPMFQHMLPLDLPPVNTRLPAVREITRAFNAERMRFAVSTWYNTEARTFAVDPVITPHDVSARLLLALGLEALEGATAESLQVAPIPANRVLAGLFAVASTGGPHEGAEGAYGRLHAWTSLGALAGAPPDADYEVVSQQVQACTWFYFEAPTAWFYDAGWDLGILALRPGGGTLAVLAATATD